PPHRHDACFLPRQVHFTGDIDIHEMAYIGSSEELWFVNTRFSCLCTLDRVHSFVPQWRPPFISAYDLTDRCHLNGLAVRNEQPRYVTALGETDTAGGWRKNKANGGILMDITNNRILCRGLSMPHSPRWYRDQLWVLESGYGSLAKVNLETGTWETVATLPGFTRGLQFWGDFAFIGLSQVRESAVFSGLPLTQSKEPRHCGVWVVNIKTGETVAFLRFEEGVQEIFAVSVLPNLRFPEIIDGDETLLRNSYVLPDAALQETVQPSEMPRTINDYLQLGNQAYYQRDLITAAQHYHTCLEQDPNFTIARYNLGVVYLEQEQSDLAFSHLQEVIANDPYYAEAYNNLGLLYHRQKNLSKAIEYFRHAISIRDQFPDAHFNLGLTLLEAGEFLTGWEEAEWRWQTPKFTPFQYSHPQWQGEDITDKTILVSAEQGAGDAIQFVRYLPLLRQRCGRLLLSCNEALKPLLATVEGVDGIYLPSEISTGVFDTYIPLMSLPYIFQTTLETIPNTVPYVGKGLVEQPLVLPEINPQQPKIGIVWAGSPTHQNDHHRSCRLENLLPLLQLSGYSFYSLQKGEATESLQRLPDAVSMVDLSPQLTDYGQTARAIQALDLVIGVDTSVIHLAGALGKPVWTLLSQRADWRWLLNREDSPWYPTMRLFRQKRLDDWKTVVQEVVMALQQLSSMN
ncbi:MAG: TIGR03032 family protein, partial [Halothece sp. Uz-M2-17]|nr:TIGR03032 family protein [Halothece sp. Uz-M2-17]